MSPKGPPPWRARKPLPRQLENDLVFAISTAKLHMSGGGAFTKSDWDRIIRLQRLVHSDWNDLGQRP